MTEHRVSQGQLLTKEDQIKKELVNLEDRCIKAYGTPNSVDIVNMFIGFIKEINGAKNDDTKRTS